MQIDLAIIINENFTDSSLAIILDIFRTANVICQRRGEDFRFQINIVAAEKSMVTSKYGMKIQPDLSIDQLTSCHAVFLPGTWIEQGDEFEPLLAQAAAQKIVEKLERTKWGDTILAASCSGVGFLAESGLLNAQPATVSWWMAAYSKKRWPKVLFDSQNMLQKSGNIITAGAVFSQIDLSLHLLAHFGGNRLAKECSNILLLRQRDSQTASIELQYLSASDNVISKAERWVSENINRQFDMLELTDHLGVGSRTFARRLKQCLDLTPIGFVQRMRVEKAVALLKVSEASIEQISFQVGYHNASSLAKLIKKQTGQTAGSLRGTK